MPIQRGEIYFVNLNPVQGREQAGTRPVLVLSIDAINHLPVVVTMVVGTKGSNIKGTRREGSRAAGKSAKPHEGARRKTIKLDIFFVPLRVASWMRTSDCSRAV